MVKKAISTFKELWSNKKIRVFGTIGIVAVLMITMTLKTLSDNKIRNNRSQISLDAKTVSNRDAGYNLSGRAEERIALDHSEAQREKDALSKENPTFIEHTVNEYGNRGRLVIEREDKNREPTIQDKNEIAQNTINDILSESEPEPVSEIEDVEISRQRVDSRGNPQSTEKLLSEDIKELENIYAMFDAYDRVEGAYVSHMSLSDRQIKELVNPVREQKSPTVIQEDFKIMPGSSFYGQLLTPLNSAFPEMKPIVKFSSGQLKGWTGVGESGLVSLGSGMVITINRVVDPKGREYQVQGLAFNDETGSPGFKDDIDNYLFQRITYGTLGDVFNMAGEVVSTRMDARNQPDIIGLNPRAQSQGNNPITCLEWQNTPNGQVCVRFEQGKSDLNERVQLNNKSKYNRTITQEIMDRSLGAAAKRSGSIIGGTFSDLANGYKTEVTVDPKTVLVVFY